MSREPWALIPYDQLQVIVAADPLVQSVFETRRGMFGVPHMLIMSPQLLKEFEAFMTREDIAKACAERLRKELLKEVEDAYGRLPFVSGPNAQELAEANKALDEIMATLDFQNMSTVDLKTIARELGLGEDALKNFNPAIEVEDRS